MPEMCSVKSCRAKRSKGGPSLHKFPDDPELQKKWIEAIGDSNFCKTKEPFVCSNHFVKECLERLSYSGGMTLKSGSIPTIFLKKEATENSEGNLTESQNKKVRQKRKYYSNDYTEEDMNNPERAKAFMKAVRGEMKTLKRKNLTLRMRCVRFQKRLTDMNELMEICLRKESEILKVSMTPTTETLLSRLLKRLKNQPSPSELQSDPETQVT